MRKLFVKFKLADINFLNIQKKVGKNSISWGSPDTNGQVAWSLATLCIKMTREQIMLFGLGSKTITTGSLVQG